MVYNSAVGNNVDLDRGAGVQRIVRTAVLLPVLVVLEEEMLGCVGDEFVADRGAQHDAVGEDRTGELDRSLVYIDGRWWVASLSSGGEDVVDWLEDAFHEAALSGYEDSVAVGVVEQHRKDRAELLLGDSIPGGGEGGDEILFEVAGDAGWGVGAS